VVITPALAVDGAVKIAGHIPRVAEIQTVLATALA
jgi:hypothetical protein